MGYLKVIVEAPGVQKTIEDLLCLSIGVRKMPQQMWWDYDEDDKTFVVMGITLKEAEKLIKYIYEKAPEYVKSFIRFRLVAYDANEYPKPKNEWEALEYMLQSFPKRRKVQE